MKKRLGEKKRGGNARALLKEMKAMAA